MQITPNKTNTTTYWSPKFTPKSSLAEKEVLNKLDLLLEQAVARRLVADVPVGLFLSGGLDSTTIAWYMKNLSEKTSINSYSVGFDQQTFDESSYAKTAAKELDTNHTHTTFTEPIAKKTLAELVKLSDIPLADASLLPTYHISKVAAENIKVVLDGDGSDELLGGYGTFKAAQVAEKLSWLRPLAPTLHSVAQFLPSDFNDSSLDFKIKSFLKGLAWTDPGKRNSIWLGSFSPRELHQLLLPQHHSHILNIFDNLQSYPNLDITDQVSAHTTAGYLYNDILVKLDRATMYASLEARTPFLDVDLADFIMKLPTKYKQDKLILKKLMRGRIPDDIIDRPKKGFGIPLAYRLAGPWNQWMKETLSPENLSQHNLFNQEYINKLIQEHTSRKHDHRKKLWTLLTWQLWYQNYGRE